MSQPTHRLHEVRAHGPEGLPVYAGETDVVVVGGGLAGCWAALAAAESGERVCVVDKGRPGASGCSPFAGAVVLCMGPDDDFDGFLAEQLCDGEGLADPGWISQVYESNYQRIRQLDSWGAPLERTADGTLQRRKVNVGSRKTVYRLKYDSVRLMKFFYRQLKHRGRTQPLRLFEHTAVIGLVIKDGVVAGVVAVNRHDPCIIVLRARSVVLAAGGCGFKGNHFALDSVCGEAYALALDAGARLVSMEFANGYIATCRHFNSHGQSLLAALGGQYINGRGKPFLHRYAAEVPAPPQVVCRAMAAEVKAGRGPIYFDLRGIEPDVVADWKETFYLIQRLADRSGIDIFAEPVEWYPGLTGTVGAGGGLFTPDPTMATDVPGLYAAGDAASKTPVVGGGSGITFLNLAWANATGWWAGESAARYARNSGESAGHGPDRLDGAEALAVAQAVAPLHRPPVEIDPLYHRLQEHVVPAEVSLLREPEALAAAASGVARLLAAEIARAGVADVRQLVKWHELRASGATAQAMFAAALAREESRGWHYRTDHPRRDDDHWRCWLTVTPDTEADGSPGLRLDRVPVGAGSHLLEDNSELAQIGEVG